MFPQNVIWTNSHLKWPQLVTYFFSAVFCFRLGLVTFPPFTDHCQGTPTISLSPKNLDHIFPHFFHRAHTAFPPPEQRKLRINEYIFYSFLFQFSGCRAFFRGRDFFSVKDSRRNRRRRRRRRKTKKIKYKLNNKKNENNFFLKLPLQNNKMQSN